GAGGAADARGRILERRDRPRAVHLPQHGEDALAPRVREAGCEDPQWRRESRGSPAPARILTRTSTRGEKITPRITRPDDRRDALGRLSRRRMTPRAQGGCGLERCVERHHDTHRQHRPAPASNRKEQTWHAGLLPPKPGSGAWCGRHPATKGE